jgi:4-amino-4-deoxy-L-arabinose transferase-like glycosyltransferase
MLSRVTRSWVLVSTCAILFVCTLVRWIFASKLDLRVNEAYYWTWSKENVLSFLDHPPMVAWFIRFGTALFGDTPFGVRFAGLLAMLVMQVLLADIVMRRTRNLWAVAFVVLAPEAALYYGQMMALASPGVPLVLFLSGLLWAMTRLEDSRNPTWWLAAGAFGGLMLLSTYTAVFVMPAILAFVFWPPRNRRWARTPWPWLALVVAVALFSPVLIWNAQHAWASFRLRFDRFLMTPSLSASTIGDHIGVQFGLIGPLLFPVAVINTALACWRGYRRRDAVLVLLTTAAAVPFLYFLLLSATRRIDIMWPMFIWPPALAAVAIVLADVVQRDLKYGRSRLRWALAAIGIGIIIVPSVSLYYVFGTRPLLGRFDPVGRDGGYQALASAVVAKMHEVGATWIATTEYRTYAILRWELRDRAPVIQINERSRFIGFQRPDLTQIKGRPGLWVVSRSMMQKGIWQDTTATRQQVGSVDRIWRGRVFDTFELEKITNWAPQLTPPPGSPLFPLSTGWQLAFAVNTGRPG